MPEGKKSIKELVAERIAGAGDERKSRVVEILVEEVIESQVKAIQKGLELQDQATQELGKIQSTKTFALDGSLHSETYTQENLGKKKKAQERLNQITQALDKALDEENFDSLNKLVKSGGGEPQKQE